MNDQNMSKEQAVSEPFLNVPMAIVIAGLIIAGSIVYVNRGKINEQVVQNQIPSQVNVSEMAKNILPLNNGDHILGKAEAPVSLVLFSDTECPFCKKFHLETVVNVIEKYVDTGKVKLVFRYAPLDSLHAKARPEAEALECVALLGGEETFWAYVHKLYLLTPSNDGLEPKKLVDMAKEANIDESKFIECQKSANVKSKVQAQLEDAMNSGMNGTPYSIIIASNGDKIPVEGAQSFATVSSQIEKALTLK